MTTIETHPRGWDEVPGLLQSAWRYKWMIAAAVLLGAVVGYGWSSRQPTLYEGVSRVLLADPSTIPGVPPQQAGEPERYLRNQGELMSTQEVLKRAAARSGGRASPGELGQRLNVDVAPDSDVITIRVVDSTADGAAELASSVGAAYEEFIAERSRQAADDLRAARARLETRLRAIQAELTAKPNDDRLQRQREAASGELLEIERQLLTTVRAAESNPVGVREDARVPEQPIQPAPRRATAIGMLFGLVGSGALAWWLSGRRVARRGRKRLTGGGKAGDWDGALTRPGSPEPAGDIVEPILYTLAKDPNIDWEAVTDLMVRLDMTLAGASLAPYLEAVPRVMVKEVTSGLSTDVVAVLLDNGGGSFRVAGGMGLLPDEYRRVVDQNHEALRHAFWNGVGIVPSGNGAHLATADLPGGRTAETLVMVPLVQDSYWLGMLCFGRRGDYSQPVNRFTNDEIAYGIRCAVNFTPVIQTLIVADRLQQALRALRSFRNDD
jgi:capsular polysaccharide biosynthesis protein